MDISYLGHSSFLLKGRSVRLVTDPYDSGMVGLKYPKVEADIVTVSHEHKDHNQVGQVGGEPRIVRGPGEYEIKGATVIGMASYHDDVKGKRRGKNTIYVIEMDKLRLVHLGDLGHGLGAGVYEKLGEVDVLMIPVGGVYTIGPKKASELVSDIEPKVVLPMHYMTKGLSAESFKGLANADEFLGQVHCGVEKMDKLKIKVDNLSEETKVVMLENRS